MKKTALSRFRNQVLPVSLGHGIARAEAGDDYVAAALQDIGRIDLVRIIDSPFYRSDRGVVVVSVAITVVGFDLFRCKQGLSSSTMSVCCGHGLGISILGAQVRNEKPKVSGVVNAGIGCISFGINPALGNLFYHPAWDLPTWDLT